MSKKIDKIMNKKNNNLIFQKLTNSPYAKIEKKKGKTYSLKD